MKPCERDVINEQQFRILKVYKDELEKATAQSYCVCDTCLAQPDCGYYVAVLNRWLCPKCFNRWLKDAVRYPEDMWIEERNYQYYRHLLNFD